MTGIYNAASELSGISGGFVNRLPGLRVFPGPWAFTARE